MSIHIIRMLSFRRQGIKDPLTEIEDGNSQVNRLLHASPELQHPVPQHISPLLQKAPLVHLKEDCLLKMFLGPSDRGMEESKPVSTSFNGTLKATARAENTGRKIEGSMLTLW